MRSLFWLGLFFNRSTEVHTPQLEAMEQYNILHYLGGAGPYFQYPGYGISPNLPPDCELEQVYMIARHGERYPTTSAGMRFEQTLAKIQQQQVLNGSLHFFETYEYFVQNKSNYDQEVTLLNSDSMFSGSMSSFRNGRAFRDKYNILYNAEEVIPVFTTNSQRCYDTSVNFMKGFMDEQYDERKVKYVIIDEDGKMGANSLTPRNGCSSFGVPVDPSKYNLTSHLDVFRERLQRENPNLQLTYDDLDNLFQMCAYELNVRGYSPICQLLHPNELLFNEFKQDLKLYHEVGYGNAKSTVVGSVILKALVKLFTEPQSNKIWVNFAHDHDLVTFYTSLGLFKEELNSTINFDRKFRKSLIVPQSTRLIIEKFRYKNDQFIRVILNESVIPLNCAHGPGFSCKLDWFMSHVKDSVRTNYNTQCGGTGPNEITFYWDYQSVNYHAQLVP